MSCEHCNGYPGDCPCCRSDLCEFVEEIRADISCGYIETLDDLEHEIRIISLSAARSFLEEDRIYDTIYESLLNYDEVREL